MCTTSLDRDLNTTICNICKPTFKEQNYSIKLMCATPYTHTCRLYTNCRNIQLPDLTGHKMLLPKVKFSDLVYDAGNVDISSYYTKRSALTASAPCQLAVFMAIQLYVRCNRHYS